MRSTKVAGGDRLSDTSGVPSDLLARFAAQHGLRMRRDDDDQWMCGGKAGGIYSAGDDQQQQQRLLVAINLSTSLGRWWWHSVISPNPRVAKAIVGSIIDGVFTVDPADKELVAVAIRAICPTRPRKSSTS